MNRGRTPAAGCVGALLLASGAARAEDLRTAVDRVVESWHDSGAQVDRDEPRFLHEGETVTLLVPGGPEKGCQTIALIGGRGMTFHARASGEIDTPVANLPRRPRDPDLDLDERVTSVAGVLELSSCQAPSFRYVRVTSEAGRGAIESLVARSSDPVPALRTILLERTGGVLPAPPEPGALPPLPAPEKRAEVAEARARREGAKLTSREQWSAGADGKGEGRVVLEAGCHRLELFAPDPRLVPPARPGVPSLGTREHRLDLDATLRDEDGELIAHDHTMAPDARIDACVGQATTTMVLFEGAPPGSPVLSTHASLPIPEHLPATWGRDTRARMAAAILPRHVLPPTEDAVLLAQGASGMTPVPIPIEPGACYLAVAALDRGHARGLGLRATVGAQEYVDERGVNDDSSAVTFCAMDRDHARIDVEARSTGVTWGLAIFRVASGMWDARP